MNTHKSHSFKIGTKIFIFFLLFFSLSCQEKKDATKAKAEANVAVEAPSMDLHTAVISGNIDVVKQHIQAKSDINVLDPFGGSTPLISASTFGKTEIAKLLIAAGAKLDIQNADGSTALITASFFCRPDIVKLLLEKGADKSITNNYGSTALQSVSGSFDQVKPSYDMLGKMLKPMGLILDYDFIKKTRPEIAKLLAD